MANMRLHTIGCARCNGRVKATVNLDTRVIDEIILSPLCLVPEKCWPNFETMVFEKLDE